MIFRMNLRHLTITLSRWTMNLRFAHDLWTPTCVVFLFGLLETAFSFIHLPRDVEIAVSKKAFQ